MGPLEIARTPLSRTYAFGSRRAELSKWSVYSKTVRWRVWEVFGPVTIGKGMERGMTKAKEQAFALLTAPRET